MEYGNSKNNEEGKFVSRVKVKLIKERNRLYAAECLNNPAKIIEMTKKLFQDADREKMVVISLSSCLEPIAYEIIAIGSLSACIFDVKSVLKHALLANAAYVICVHNHPSENPHPSDMDLQTTEKLRKAGELMDIELLDHIVYGTAERFYSFREHNWQKE